MSAIENNVQLANLLLSLSKNVSSGKGEEEVITKQGGTKSSTKQTILSQAAMDAAMKSALEGPQGLAAVMSGQKAAGLYNTSARTMLANDLITRSAAEIAKVGAPTITTDIVQQPETTTILKKPVGRQGVTGKGGLADLALLAGATYMFGKDAKTGKRGYEDLFSAVGSYFNNTSAGETAVESLPALTEELPTEVSYVSDISQDPAYYDIAADFASNYDDYVTALETADLVTDASSAVDIIEEDDIEQLSNLFWQ